MEDVIGCEVRFAVDDSRLSPGRLIGTLVAYETRAKDRPEMFMADSLYWPELGIIIDEQHNREAPILRAIPVLEGRELKIDAKIPDTQRGRDAATNVREGVLTGLSVAFRAERVTHSNGIREIRRAYVPRAGLVDSPSYGDSVVEVRGRSVWQLDRSAYLWL